MLSDQVCHAELCCARFVAEHNLPFAVADHFNSLVPIMFPDIKSAAEFGCARTKTAALITHALAPAANEPVVNAVLTLYIRIHCIAKPARYGNAHAIPYMAYNVSIARQPE